MNAPNPSEKRTLFVTLDRYEATVAAGNSATFQIHIENQGSSEEYFEIRLRGAPSDWVQLSVPPVVAIPAGQSLDANLTIRPPAPPRSQPGAFTVRVRVTSQEHPENSAEAAAQLTVTAVEASGRVGLILEETDFSLAPGSRQTAPVVVINHGDQEDFFELSVRGMPSSWVSFSQPVVELRPNERREVTMTIHLPPAPQARAGQYTIKVRATSQSDRSQSVEVEFNLAVAAFEVRGRIGVLMEATQFSVSPGSAAVVPLVLLNQGLEEDAFRLDVAGIPTSWVSTSTPTVRLEPGERRDASLTIQPPRNAQSRAGRHRFTVQVISQAVPDQMVEIPCTLTMAAFNEFNSVLEPLKFEADETARVNVQNTGNVVGTYTVTFSSEGDRLVFEALQRVNGAAADEEEDPAMAATRAAPAGEAPGATAKERTFVPVQSLTVRVPPGGTENIEFRARPRSSGIFGNEVTDAFKVTVEAGNELKQTHNGQVVSRALIPFFVLPVLLGACILLVCVAAGLLWWNRSRTNQAAATAQTATAAVLQQTMAATVSMAAGTQTSAANQTLAAESGQQDSDGDGLTNQRETEIGTDPFNPDSDGDELGDGDEVNRGTNPLNRDSDNDALTDGDEVLRRNTNPLNPDSDGDGLLDGDEVNRGTNPLNADTDGDGLNDFVEIQQGTNPLNPDTDNDRLLDGQESPPCPNPLDPDTDRDGLIDGQDLNPCDPNNPSLTATAAAGIPTVPPPTPTQPVVVDPTAAPPPTDAPPTEAPAQRPTVAGRIAYESNRDGQPEIYVENGSDFSVARLTVDPGLDSQPAWSPDGSRLAFVTNRDGNQEVYLMNADGSGLINLSNNPAGDQFPTWSPDGSRIAFASNRDGNWEVYVVNTDGSDPVNISNHPATDLQPSWFQGSGRIFTSDMIAFTTDRDGNQEIYVMNPDGSDPINLSNNPAADFHPGGSSNGLILFVSNRDGNQEVYSMSSDGSGQTNLSNNPAQEDHPTWSPDNNQIAFTTNRDGNQEIYVMSGNGADVFNFTRNPAQDLYADWR